MVDQKTKNQIAKVVKKLFLSTFVAGSFIAYALQNNSASSAKSQVAVVASPTASATATDPNNTSGPAAAPTATNAAASASSSTGGAASTTASPAAATAEPTQAPAATATSSSGYKDGTYTGPVVDINWGYVQVQTTIQNGQIASVQFLQYPTERRTSARINSFAVPELQQEAVQAQSANVNIITGATLTSEGFQYSLSAALAQAGG